MAVMTGKNDVIKLTISDTQAVLKLSLNAQFVEPGIDLWAATMDQDWADPNS